MFLPARMRRVVLGGHKSQMADAIETLHRQGVVHLEDYQDPTGTTSIGTPLESGDATSALLLRVRGILKSLDAEDMGGKDLATDHPETILADAEKVLLPLFDSTSQVRSDLASLHSEVQQLTPFAGLDLELSTLTGLQSVVGFAGTVRSDPLPALVAQKIPLEGAFDADKGTVAVFVRLQDKEATEAVLSKNGFSASQLPDGNGTPAQRLGALAAERAELENRLAGLETQAETQRNEWGPRLAALESYLASEVDKTQAPLQFGVTETTFHVEGWLPADHLEATRAALHSQFGDQMYFEDLGDAPLGHGDVPHDAAHHHEHEGHDHGDHHVDPKDEAPVKLDNRGAASPYEYLLGLLGRPRYQEIDPTKLMLIFFPLFFGLMVGDLVLGIAIMGVGVFLKSNKVFGIGGPAVGRAMIAGGLMSAIVGGVIFGEGLGIHFVVDDHGLEEGELSWEAIFYGKEEVLAGTAGFSHDGFIHKTSHAAVGESHGAAAEPHTADPDAADPVAHTADDPTAHTDDGHTEGADEFALHAEEEHEAGMFTAAALKPHSDTHLSVNGWFNLGYYSKTHDALALLIWSMMIGFVHLVIGLIIGVRNVAMGHGVALAIQEKASWLILIVGVGLIIGGLGGNQALLWGGVAISIFSVGLLYVGVQKVLGAGFIAFLEIPGFFGNILSYTRLAAIGASKAGMAVAFGNIAFDVIGGGDIHHIGGWIFYIASFGLILVLAIIAGFLQSLRLQFVEFFGKFFEGGGRPYVPFGRRSP